MVASVIQHRLSLVLVLIDTTTGHTVDERDVLFYSVKAGEKSMVPMKYRVNGTWLLSDTCREDFHMQILAKGYETCEIDIRNEELPEAMPLKEVFLIPSEDAYRMDDLLTLRNCLPGLKRISGVSLTDILAHTDTYDKRRQVMKVFEKGYRLNMEGSAYGVINRQEGSFAEFEVAEQPATDSVKLRKPYPGPLPKNASVARVLEGQVRPEGEFLFRILRSGRHTKYLLRFELEDKVLFREYDFADPKDIDFTVPDPAEGSDQAAPAQMTAGAGPLR